MPQEIERKFLLRTDAWRTSAGAGTPYQQGYLSTDKARTVRVRLAGARGYLTVKGPTLGATRDEFEYEIPEADARAMIERLCERIVVKTRHRVAHEGHTWEIDEFHGENAGLLVAEIELRAEDEAFARPDWLGAEVTDDPRYFNANLARAPFSTWPAGSAPPR
jgi:adenylate cyclase